MAHLEQRADEMSTGDISTGDLYTGDLSTGIQGQHKEYSFLFNNLPFI